MTMEGGAGVVPVMDLNRNNYGDGFGYGGGAWFMWIIVLFALMGGWGNNRNNGLESALTRSDLANGFDAQDIKNGIRGVQNGLCDGFYAQNTTMLNGFSTIGAVRAENYRNTCEITNAIHAEGEATRALINANTMQDLRDKLADRDRDLQTANFQLSQQAQSANIISTLRPFPQPAYITCSPYTAANNCGCGC